MKNGSNYRDYHFAHGMDEKLVRTLCYRLGDLIC